MLITAVNIVVGLTIGVISHGLPIGEAFHTYTVLTAGDGLVSQIPALIISIAAGLLVSKGGIKGKTGTTAGRPARPLSQGLRHGRVPDGRWR